MELIRSVVFVPGNRPNMLERALSFAADVIMVDLEDSVPLAEKVNAREVAREWVPKLRRQGRRVMVRVNSLDTGLTHDELAAVIGPDLSGISIGKAESVWHLRDADGIITALESAAGLEAGHVKLHDLRHFHASVLLQSGQNPVLVSKRLGHSTVSMTLDIYGHLLPGWQREAAEVFAKAMSQGN